MTLKNRLEKLWILFIIMCIIGWIYETVLEVCVYHWGFSNRGILFGPWLPIYGVGGLLYVGSCYPISKSERINKFLKVLLIFLVTGLVATIVELGATYILEAVKGSWPWDYTRYALNFQGRIALSTSIRFGLCGLLGMYIVYPATEKLCTTLNDRKPIALHIIFAGSFLLFLADVVQTFVF